MIDSQSNIELNSVIIQTTSGRGFTPEEIAERALNKIMAVSDSAPQVIKDQALAYRANIREVLVHYMKEAVRSDRTTLINKFTNAGHPELVEILRT
jgi:hypothetical protein